LEVQASGNAQLYSLAHSWMDFSSKSVFKILLTSSYIYKHTHTN